MRATLRRRFDAVSEMRAYAQQVEALERELRGVSAADRDFRSPLAESMRARAKDVMRRDDPTEGGTYRAETVFANFGPKRAARAVSAETRAPHRRIEGTIGLAKAA